MNFSGYHHHQQQQHQHAYDPSQIQPYDQSYQPYYGYNQQYPFAYFPSHVHSISDTHQALLPFQQEPTSIHPPGLPIPPQQPPQRATHAPDLNLSTCQGLLDQQYFEADKIVDGHELLKIPGPMTGSSQYRGRGGRGGRSFRGGGRGQFNHQGPAPYRGRGRGRHFPSHSSGPAISNVADAPAAAGATSVVQPSSSVSGKIPLPKPAQVPAAPSQPPSRKAWCEICKVECNTPEILEQHKIGKRHKKNFQVHEELQRRKAINGQIPTSQLNLTDQPKKVQESEKKECPTENMGSEVTDDNHKDEIELQNNVGETAEVPAGEPEGKAGDNSAVRGCGLKRKMKGGRGCKYMRTNNDGSRRPVEPPKPEQAISFICELCNVKCESQVAYHNHLTGKKHLSSLKSVHGPQSLYGKVGLQALYPPDINALSKSINAQVQQGVSDPQVLLAQLLMTVLCQAQVPAIAPPSEAATTVAAQIPAPTTVAGSSSEPQFQNVSQNQVSEIAAHVEIKNPTGETKNQLLSVPLELDAPAGSSISTQIAGGSSETKDKVLKLPRDSSGMTPSENTGAANDQGPSECEAPTS